MCHTGNAGNTYLSYVHYTNTQIHTYIYMICIVHMGYRGNAGNTYVPYVHHTNTRINTCMCMLCIIQMCSTGDAGNTQHTYHDIYNCSVIHIYT